MLDTPWCAVETGLPGNTGTQGQVVLHKQPIVGLDVSRTPLGVSKLEYHDEFSKDALPGVAPVIQLSPLADGTWLMAIDGPGPWYESTSSLLQLDTSGSTVRLRSAHLGWSADVPPLHAWAALDGGSIRFDDSDLRKDGRVRLDFRLEGELVGKDGPPPSGPVRKWATGRVEAVLAGGALPPLPAELVAWFEGLAARG